MMVCSNTLESVGYHLKLLPQSMDVMNHNDHLCLVFRICIPSKCDAPFLHFFRHGLLRNNSDIALLLKLSRGDERCKVCKSANSCYSCHVSVTRRRFVQVILPVVLQGAKGKGMGSWRNVFCFASLILLLGIFFRSVAFAQSSGVNSSSHRKLSFSREHSLGSLLLLPPHKTIGTAGEQIAGAKGDVTVDLPANNLLIFEPNQYVFLHPESLDTASVAGVDALRISFLSMDPTEDALCDKLLKHISRFSNVSILSIADSDATDKGVVAAMSIPHVKSLVANRTGLTGQFLKTATNLDELKALNLGECPLGPEVYKQFAKLKSLTKLSISKEQLNLTKLNDLSSCANLTDLDVSRNPKIDDTCVKAFLRFKKLQSLNLTDTSISTQGLKSLIPLKLKQLWLPKPFYSEKDKSILSGSFGSAIQPSTLNTGRRHDMESILAPTSVLKPGR